MLSPQKDAPQSNFAPSHGRREGLWPLSIKALSVEGRRSTKEGEEVLHSYRAHPDLSPLQNKLLFSEERRSQEFASFAGKFTGVSYTAVFNCNLLSAILLEVPYSVLNKQCLMKLTQF